jgi:hypothetical protein
MGSSNPLSAFFRETARRLLSEARPGDPRYQQSAAALENLADHAERMAAEDQFQMRYLLEHHVRDGAYTWRDGQSGRSVARYGFDRPIYDPMELDVFLMDMVDMAKVDACRHIGDPQNGFDRADAEQIAKRYGLSLRLVHHALDTGRGYRSLYAVGIPHWHELSAEARTQLEALDGVKIVRGSKEDFPAEKKPPLVACNIVADDEEHARTIVAEIAGIEMEALGAALTDRVL